MMNGGYPFDKDMFGRVGSLAAKKKILFSTN